MNGDQLAALQGLAAGKIKDAAASFSLAANPNLMRILPYWTVWGRDSREPVQWLQDLIREDHWLILILTNYLSEGSAQSIYDSVSRPIYRLDPEWFKPYLDPDSIIQRVRNLLKGDLTGRPRLALSRFVKEYDLRQQGEDPSRPGSDL